MNEKFIEEKLQKREFVLSTKIQKTMYISNAIYYNELIFNIEEVLLSIKYRDFKKTKMILKFFLFFYFKVYFACLIRKFLQIDYDKFDF